MKKIAFIIIILFSFSNCQSQTKTTEKDFRVMFYNVENLFDTQDNPKTNDDDFLPTGANRWTNSRYWKKLHEISKVITMVGEGRPPALVGLCEVENDTVMHNLTKQAALNRHKYEYIITHSPDARGMNVALLYQRDEMKFIHKKEYKSSKNARHILHVVGKVVNGETLDIFVCHFPSRREGVKKSEPYRIETAQLIKQKVDSVFKIRKNANIIIMGDFNDYPNNTSIRQTLGARSIKEDIKPNKLYNMFLHRAKTPKDGSYLYRGKWGFLDQFIVSGNLLNESNKISIKNNEAHVYKEDFLLQNNKKGNPTVYRTYSGLKYVGGYSDHLPIYMNLNIK